MLIIIVYISFQKSVDNSDSILAWGAVPAQVSRRWNYTFPESLYRGESFGIEFHTICASFEHMTHVQTILLS